MFGVFCLYGVRFWLNGVDVKKLFCFCYIRIKSELVYF